MKENKLAELSMDFSVRIIALVKDLKAKHESVIANQIGRSGASIGANIREAHYAHSKPDFINKLQDCIERMLRNRILADSSFQDSSCRFGYHKQIVP